MFDINTNCSVLIVDDDEVFSDSFCELLRLDGVVATSARDKVKAVCILDEFNGLNVAIIDLQLSDDCKDSSGFELIERLNKSYKELVIVVYSGTSESGDITRAFQLGVNEFFFKGVHTYDDIFRYLKKL